MIKLIYKQIPNLITLSRVLLLPLIMYFLWTPSIENNYWATAIFIIIGFSDMLDGILARHMNAVSNIGKIIDPTADKLAVLVVSLMLIHLNRLNVIIPILILSREFLIITLRAVAASENIIMQASNEAKWKTILQMLGLGALILYKNSYLNMPIIGYVSLILSIIIAWYSAALYLYNYLKTHNNKA